MAFDRYVTFEHCAACELHHDLMEYRFLGITFSTAQFDQHNEFFSQIASGLGKPCNHRYVSTRKRREWGMLFPARPRMSITCCLSADERAERYLRDKIIILGQQDPSLAREFHEWLETEFDKDLKYLGSLVDRVKANEKKGWQRVGHTTK